MSEMERANVYSQTMNMDIRGLEIIFSFCDSLIFNLII